MRASGGGGGSGGGPWAGKREGGRGDGGDGEVLLGLLGDAEAKMSRSETSNGEQRGAR